MPRDLPWLVALGLIGTAVIVVAAIRIRDAMDAPLTENDHRCGALEEMIARRERERVAADRERSAADEHWMGVEAYWLAFLAGWPVLDEADR